MTIKLSVPDLMELRPRITVFGVGGAGGNAVSNMITANLEGVDFVVANTDAQALAQSQCDRRVQMGSAITEGLGAGSRPEVGRAAAEESMNEIMDHLSGSHMVFITAGMGGGTGTGAGPVIARAAKDQGILTVGVVTKPFQFEGARRMRIAEEGIEELQQFADTLLVIPNQNLFRIANENTTFADAFAMADEVLHSGVRGITDLMVMPGLINLDFADVRAVMNEMGKAMMGTGEAQGEKRAIDAAEAAISNPLLDDVSMKGARGVLINITGGLDLGLYEVDEAANRIRAEVDPDANIIVGSTFDERLEGSMRVSVVATGIDVIDADNVVPLPDSRLVETNTPMEAPAFRTAREALARPQVHAMAQEIEQEFTPEPAIAEMQAVEAIVEDLPTAEVHEEPAEEVTPEPVVAELPQPVPVSQPAPAGYLRQPLGQAASTHHISTDDVVITRQMPIAETAEEPNPVADPGPPPVIETDGAEEEVAGRKRGGMSVFDRMMAGVRSAKQANRVVPEERRAAPTVARSSRTPTPPPPRVAAPEEPQPSREQLFQVSEDEEQLEIPAFLRRQAN